MTSSIDPHTACVDYCFESLDPEGNSVGRVYYWYEPENSLPAVHDWEFRQGHPEISDHRWRALFCEAFERGQRHREAEMRNRGQREEDIQRFVGIARLFGPRWVRISKDDHTTAV